MEYLDQLRNLGRRLEETNAGLMAWDMIDQQKRWPKDRRQAVQRPRLSRRALKLQLVLLLADMSRLEQEISAAPYMASN